MPGTEAISSPRGARPLRVDREDAGERAPTARDLAEDLYALCRAGLIRLDGDDRGQLRACILDEDA